ncbi:MAG: sulfite exporter TauE/SafE family protein [bacterium]|nr:sulfite exporter TauE/SafE family protein [bacterium]
MRLVFVVQNLSRENANAFEDAAKNVSGVQRVDTWPGRAEFDVVDQSAQEPLLAALHTAGFSVAVPPEHKKPDTIMKVQVGGMTCRSCELLIERSLKTVPGVKKVEADAGHGTVRVVCADGCSVPLEKLQQALGEEKYQLRGLIGSAAETEKNLPEKRPSFLRIIGLFALVILVGALLDRLGLLGQKTGIEDGLTFAAAVVIGLVAGSSSCLAVSGGLLLGSASAYNKRYAHTSRDKQMKPVLLFVLGRVVSYGLLGGLIGILGSTFTFSPLATGLLTVLAAFYMLIMGLDMLHIAPQWLKRCLPRMPKSLSHKIVDAEGKEHWAAPFLLGAATFFLPCGFTQSLQVFALTTGSFFASASVLAGFAVGTAPALLALGWASSALKGKAGKLFFQFSGALVIVLGLWNIQNGLTVAGYPLTMPNFSRPDTAIAANASGSDPNVVLEGDTQVITMKLTARSPYYSPSDVFTVQAGKPVRMVINGRGTGCRGFFQIPKARVGIPLDQNVNVVEFTPKSAGNYTFSCSMGMYRGTLRVVES